MIRSLVVIGVIALAFLGGAASAEAGPGEPDAASSTASEDAAFDALLDEDEFDDGLNDGSDGDPLEGMNRGVLALNQVLDRFVFDPVTEAYQFVFPEFAREGVNNVFLNLQSPVIFVNHMLQFRGKDALSTLGRFAINTTAGGGGFFDAAGRGANLPRVDADFGQTLAAWGTPPGPYLVLPVFGPSTIRDATGDLVDRGMDPLTYLIGPVQWWIPIGLSQGLATRDANIQDLNILKESSVDFYSALRSAYLQSREAAVRDALGQGNAKLSEPDPN